MRPSVIGGAADTPPRGFGAASAAWSMVAKDGSESREAEGRGLLGMPAMLADSADARRGTLGLVFVVSAKVSSWLDRFCGCSRLSNF